MSKFKKIKKETKREVKRLDDKSLEQLMKLESLFDEKMKLTLSKNRGTNNGK